MNNKYDVIIVGCGVAGCFAALHLPKEKNILMITKSSIEESDSFLAQGGICVLRDDDDYEDFFQDTMRAGHYQNSKDSVAEMIISSRGIINELIDFGVEFTMENGELRYTREGGHGKNRILYHEDVTGKEITSKLLVKVRELPNLTLLEHTEMIDILSRNNRCYGILARTNEGEIVPVFAEYVLWACGGIGGIYKDSTNFPHLTGDTIAIAHKRNIRLRDVSYVQIHPTTLYSNKKERRFLISESVRGEGAHLYDKNGNRFVDELLPRDLLTAAIKEQMKKDNTEHVWLSMLPITEVDVRERFPNIYKKCLEEGYDVTKDWIPVVPSQHYFMGGVYVDIDACTTMRDLYCAGEACCNGVHGANRLASNSLLESLVFARNAVRHICAKDSCKEFFAQTDREEKLRDIRLGMARSLDELAAIYDLELDLYKDEDAYSEEKRRRIHQEIDRDIFSKRAR